MPAWWRRAFVDGVYPLEKLVATPGWRERTRRETDFIFRALRLRPQGSVLDVPCGTGRHSVALARRGCRVTGVDISARYLSAAARAARLARAPLALKRLDMRALPWRGAFDAAMNLFTSFGYFQTPAQDGRALRAVHRALRPGGLFLIDTLNGPVVARQIDPRRWTELPDKTLVLEEASYDRALRVIRTRWIVVSGGRRREALSFVRLYSRASLTRALRGAGFQVLRLWGNPQGRSFLPGVSRRLVFLCRKPS